MVAGLAPHLPHPGTAVGPVTCSAVRELGDEALDLGVQLAELLAVEVQSIEQLAVDIELGLIPRPVAHAHRRGLAPAA